MRNNVILVIMVIVSLSIGGGGAYTIASSQVTTLTNEKVNLQTQVDYLLTRVADLSSEKNQLQNQVTYLTDEVSTLNAEKTSLQVQVSSLTSENTALTTSVDLLAETIDAMHSSEWTQTAAYNITAGTMKTQLFIVDKFGIVWETDVDFSGTSVSVAYYYWYKGIRNYVISFRQSLITQNNPDIPYYGPQDYLYGEIKLDISPDWKGSNQIWFGYHTTTQFPEVRMGGNMFVDISS